MHEDRAQELARIAEELLEQAAELRRGWDALAAALDDVEAATPAAEEAPAAPARPDQEDPRRLIALNMALEGKSRDETASYLREQFGEDGTEEILTAVFDA